MRAACQTAKSYETSDFYTACFMLTRHGVTLSDVTWLGKRATFAFETDGLDVRRELIDLQNGTATVSARDFIDAIAALKRELYATPR